MTVFALSVLLGLLQSKAAGVVVGIVKLPEGLAPAVSARVVLLPPKYTELWNRQVQIRLDNYWELYKPEFAAKKERFLEFNRAAQLEGFRYVTTVIQADLGASARQYLQRTSAGGQFEFRSLPFATYELLVQATVNGQEVIWSKSVPVTSDVPVFVDLGPPAS